MSRFVVHFSWTQLVLDFTNLSDIKYSCFKLNNTKKYTNKNKLQGNFERLLKQDMRVTFAMVRKPVLDESTSVLKYLKDTARDPVSGGSNTFARLT